MSEKKRLLITGISGFTGHYVCEEFLLHGWEVFGCGVHKSHRKNYFNVDLIHAESVNKLVSSVQPNAVIHLAGIAFAAGKSSIDYYFAHVKGTNNLLESLAVRACNVSKVLLASSANVYGNSFSAIHDESAPRLPFNDYGVSKLAMEHTAWLMREKLPIVIARPFNYSGVGQAEHFLLPKIVKHFKEKALQIELGNMHVRRDYFDVRNVAFAYRRLVDCAHATGAFNICGGQTYSIFEILEMVSDISGHKLDVVVNPKFVRDGEVDVLGGSNGKLEKTIGHVDWIPLQETLRWMLETSG